MAPRVLDGEGDKEEGRNGWNSEIIAWKIEGILAPIGWICPSPVVSLKVLKIYPHFVDSLIMVTVGELHIQLIMSEFWRFIMSVSVSDWH